MMQNISTALGIGKRELDIYLTLVERGDLTARDISEVLKVPYTKVYLYLSKLEKLGIVTPVEKTRPQRYRAMAPMEVYRKLVATVSESLRQIKPFFDSLQLIYESNVQITSTFLTLVKGVEKINQLVEEVIKSADGEVYMAIPFRELLTYRLLATVVEESRRVEIKMIVKENLLPLELPPRVEVKTIGEMFGGGAIGSAAVIFVKYGGEISGIHSNDRYLIEIARTYFIHLWQKV